jgi:hypothetical protein
VILLPQRGKKCGKKRGTVTATLAGPARLLSEGAPVRFSNELLLKGGAKKPPIFLLHGLGSCIASNSRRAST